MKAREWTRDHDHYFGPFTFARGKYQGDMLVSVVLGCGVRDDEGTGAYLRVLAGRYAFLSALPPVVKPWRQWVNYPKVRSGLGGFWHEHRREYGFRFTRPAHLGVLYGRQADDSSIDRYWGHFFGFAEWRHVRHTLYQPSGMRWADIPQGRRICWEARSALEDACPTETFEFDDFDGERIRATCRVEEREWLFGAGWFRWLSLFRKPKIRRSLDIDFSAEVGPEKGSWKGGTTGHGIDMLPGETCEAAFRRYCETEPPGRHRRGKLTFVGPAMVTA